MVGGGVIKGVLAVITTESTITMSDRPGGVLAVGLWLGFHSWSARKSARTSSDLRDKDSSGNRLVGVMKVSFSYFSSIFGTLFQYHYH